MPEESEEREDRRPTGRDNNEAGRKAPEQEGSTRQGDRRTASAQSISSQPGQGHQRQHRAIQGRQQHDRDVQRNNQPQPQQHNQQYDCQQGEQHNRRQNQQQNRPQNAQNDPPDGDRPRQDQNRQHRPMNPAMQDWMADREDEKQYIRSFGGKK